MVNGTDPRGAPWEFDPGPPGNRRWARLFAETPNYRGLGVAVAAQELFRWHFGPMFYRGRLADHAVKVLVIGQEGAQDESLAHRAFTGGTGGRMQHFLGHLGITRSYLFLNTFVYPIFGQYDAQLAWLAQDPASPIVRHRHALFDYVLARNDLRLVVAVGRAAKESVATWVTARGGQCPGGPSDVSSCSGGVLDARTRTVGVLHPGGAGQGGDVDAIVASFQAASDQIAQWSADDPTWLPADPGAARTLDQPFVYSAAPIPYRDLPLGVCPRLGRKSTSSNRKDDQRAIQLFSAGGAYNGRGVQLQYQDATVDGSAEGYAADPGDLPYEPPRTAYRDHDHGPSTAFARVAMGGQAGLAWPDFTALGATADLSLGAEAVYRGRPAGASVLVLADQESPDDLFTGRALTGDAGQRFQAYLAAIGIDRSYVILRTLPIDTSDLSAAAVSAMAAHPGVVAVHQAMVQRVLASSPALGLVLTVGSGASELADRLMLGALPVVRLKAWGAPGALADWHAKLATIQAIGYPRDIAQPTFAYQGERGQIPRLDLPYGTPRWQGSSGTRAQRALDLGTGLPSPDYYKLSMPAWAFLLAPAPLSAAEQQAVDQAP